MGVARILPVQSNSELADEITLLAGHINAAEYRFLKLIAEFDRRQAWADLDIRSCAHWLNWKCGIAIGAAREKVRVARCLDLLPKINQAFSQGAISYSKARAMTRVATADNEDYLLMLAKHGTASHIEKTVRKFQPVKRRQEPYQDDKQETVSELISYQDDDGMWIINAKLPAETGALVVKAIDAIIREQKQIEQENVPAETSLETPYPQKRVDALTIMAEHYLATASRGDSIQTLAGSERCQVMLHVDIKTLQQQNDSACSHGHHHNHQEHCNLDNKQWLSPRTAKRLSCDASLVAVLEDGNKVLNIGRRSRIIPPHIQRALNLRDSSCSYPGCCASRYLDAHHIKHWADGGETSLDNLVNLCRHHHTGLHKGEYSIKVAAEQIMFIAASGKTIKQSYFPQFTKIDSGEATNQFLKSQWPDIDKNTAVSLWRGEKIDYDMAVTGLL